MSDLDRILKLASHGTADAHSQAPAERELKDVPVVEEPTTTREAVGEFAEPIYDLIDMHFEGDCQPVFDDLVRYLSGDQIEDFVADFRRNHDLNDMGDDMDEAQQLNASDYKCEDCGDTMHQPTTDCSHDCDDETGSWWKDKDGNGVPDSLEEAPNEGNEFSGALAQAKKDGKKEFEVDGKKYKVESEEAVTEGDVPEYACINTETGAFGYCNKDELHNFTHMMPAGEFTYFDPTSGVDFADFDDEMADQEGWTKIASNEEISEAPTMDTTQLITLLKNSGLSEEAINKKINEWANTPAGAAEEEATSHGEPYENFAQSVNLSLKRYLDAEDMKVGLKEHKVEDIKEAYKKSKEK
jgi:hypothetical protein